MTLLVPTVLDRPNPNFRARPASIGRIVLHAMAELLPTSTGTRLAHDFLADVGFSAHILVGPDGTVVRCVADEQMAWHAKGHNADSLGVEFLVAGVPTDAPNFYGAFLDRIRQPRAAQIYSIAQYAAGAWVIATWCETHGLEWADITTHAALDPTRKEDPGTAFDFDALYAWFARWREQAA